MIRREVHRRLALIGYAALVAGVVLAFVLYQRHVNNHLSRDNHRFAQVDRISCENRRILIQNQKTVLAVLERNLLQLVQVQGPSQSHFEQSLVQVQQAQTRLATISTC